MEETRITALDLICKASLESRSAAAHVPPVLHLLNSINYVLSGQLNILSMSSIRGEEFSTFKYGVFSNRRCTSEQVVSHVTSSFISVTYKRFFQTSVLICLNASDQVLRN